MMGDRWRWWWWQQPISCLYAKAEGESDVQGVSGGMCKCPRI